MTEKKKRSFFVLGLLIYLTLLALLLGGVLCVFRDFLAEYEATRSARALEAYEALLREKTPESAREGLAGLDTALESEEEALSWLSPKLRQAELREDAAQGSEGRKVYRVLLDGRPCGSVSFRQAEPGRFGFAPWALDEERFDFSPWFYTLSLTAPAEYQVRLGDNPLGQQHVTQSGLRFAALAECYELFEDMPTMTRYETGNLLGEQELRVYDRAGQPVPPALLEEERYLDNCSSADKERLAAFAELFLPRYIYYTATLWGFSDLSGLIGQDSALHDRLLSVSGEGSWHILECKTLSSEIGRRVDLGEGRYMMELAYETESKTYFGPVYGDYRLRLIVAEHDGKLLAENLYNY